MSIVYVNQLPPQVRAEIIRESYASICQALDVEHEHIEEVTDAVMHSKLVDISDVVDIKKYSRWAK